MFQKSFLFLNICICIASAFKYDYGRDMMIENIKEWQSKLKQMPRASEKCNQQFDLWVELLEKGPIMDNNWAWRMVDSWGKINSGILTGNTVAVGQMDECLAIDEMHEGINIKGRYCYSGLPMSLNGSESKADYVDAYNQFQRFNNIMAIDQGKNRQKDMTIELYEISICIPHECNWMEITGMDQYVDTDMCQTKETLEEYDGGDWAFIAFFIIIVVLVLVSSLYDWYIRHNNKTPVHPVTLAFSFYTNSEKLLRITNNPEQFHSLNGIRTISMMWVVTGHKFSSAGILPFVNMEYAFEWMKTTQSFYVTSALVAVDSFFFLSGIVMAYGFMKSQSKAKARFNIILYYIHRYLRLTPAMAVLYFFFVTWYKHISSGPRWPMYHMSEKNNCLDNAWSYFLYMQNFNSNRQCLGHTWYLSVDMQLFIISPLILLPMVKFPKYAGYGLVGLILLSILPPTLVTYCMDLLRNHPDYIKDYYYQPYNRMSPWLVGLLLGYIFYQLRDRKIKIHWFTNICVWVAILVGMFFILYLTPEAEATTDIRAFAVFNGFHRLCWALGLMWIVFACEKGYGGIVNWFLTLPLFQVLARLSYSMYLLHVLVQMMAGFRKRAANFFDEYDMLNQSFGDIVVVSFLAFFYCMMFESPMVVIEKILLGPNGYIMKLFGLGSKVEVREDKTHALSQVTSQSTDTVTTIDDGHAYKSDTVKDS